MSVSVGGPAEDFAATEFAELVAALPNLSVIIEHLAGMGIHATGTPVMPHDDVFRQALTLSRFPNTAIKIHGMGETRQGNRVFNIYDMNWLIAF